MKSFFKHYLSANWQKFIKSHQEEKVFKKGEEIFSIGEEVLGVFEILKGRVKVVAKNSQGEEVIIRLAGDNAILGHRGIGDTWVYPVSAVALDDTKVVFISRELFELIAKTDAAFSYHLMLFFSEQLRRTEEKNIVQPVLNKVAKTIWFNHEAFGTDKKGCLNYTIRRQEIASMSGTTYESVVRSLAELKKLKLIDTDKKSIIIKNLTVLEKLAFTHK